MSKWRAQKLTYESTRHCSFLHHCISTAKIVQHLLWNTPSKGCISLTKEWPCNACGTSNLAHNFLHLKPWHIHQLVPSQAHSSWLHAAQFSALNPLLCRTWTVLCYVALLNNTGQCNREGTHIINKTVQRKPHE